MPAATLARDDAMLQVFDQGIGPAVVFQHGLGGDGAQVALVFPDDAGWRRLTVECRGQGGSTLGRVRPFSFAMFADDVLAAANVAGLDRFVVGGISMGAAIALRLAVRHPDRIAGLLMVRPAWAFAAAPDNMRPIREVADLIRAHPLPEARRRFASSATAARLAEQAPDNLASLLGYFERPDARGFAEVLAAIAADGPGASQADSAALTVPALVVGNARDAIHPLRTARALAAAIPGAHFLETTPKADDKARNAAETRAAIDRFLHGVFSDRSLQAS